MMTVQAASTSPKTSQVCHEADEPSKVPTQQSTSESTALGNATNGDTAIEERHAAVEALESLLASGAVDKIDIAPKATDGSPHWLWPRLIDHLRQPANGKDTYWFFCEHKCSAYQDGNCYGYRQTHSQIYNLMVRVLHPRRPLQPVSAMTENYVEECVNGWKAAVNVEPENPYSGALGALKPVSSDTGIATTGTTLKGQAPESNTLQAAVELANAMGRAVFECYEDVRSLVLQCEAMIQGIWMKKNPRQRRKLLQLAAKRCPHNPWSGHGLPEKHRPECHAGIWTCQKMPEDPLDLPAFWVPHLNLEDLGEGMNVLILLKSRGRCPPAVFARQDHDNCSIIRRQGERKMNEAHGLNVGRREGCNNCPVLPFPILPGFVMIFKSADTAETWAKIYQGDEIPSELCFPVDEGLAVQKIHLFTYTFLRSLCTTLLDSLNDTPYRSSTIDNIPLFNNKSCWEQSEPAIPEASDALPSISRMLRVAPYKSPTGLDLALMESLVSSRASEASDDVWALRSDPGYLREALAEEMTHSALNIVGPGGKVSPDISDGKGSDFFWMTVIETMLRNSHGNLTLWTALLSLIKNVRVLWAANDLVALNSFDPPPDLLGALCQLFAFLRIMIDHAAKEMFLTSLSCFRDAWRIHTGIGSHKECPPLDSLLDQPGAELAALLYRIGMESPGSRLAADWVMADYAQGLMETDPVCSKLVAPLLSSRFNDWALLNEIDRQLSSLHTWAQTIQNKTMHYAGDIMEKFLKLFNDFNKCAHQTAQFVAEANFLGDDRFKYPVSALRTKQKVRRMIDSEEQLKQFWIHVDMFCAVHFTPMDDMFGCHFLRSIVPLSTIPWEETAGLSHTFNSAAGDVVDLWDLEYRTKATIDESHLMQTMKRKRKTYSTEHIQSTAIPPETEDVADGDHSGPSPGSIKLGKKAYRTLTALFHSAGYQAQYPKEIGWTDFLYAMVAAGFKVQKLWGSIWHFQPTDPAMKRSIQFHDPHPSMKLNLILSRRFGRRLNRAYGWTYETFARKETQNPVGA